MLVLSAQCFCPAVPRLLAALFPPTADHRVRAAQTASARDPGIRRSLARVRERVCSSRHDGPRSRRRARRRRLSGAIPAQRAVEPLAPPRYLRAASSTATRSRALPSPRRDISTTAGSVRHPTKSPGCSSRSSCRRGRVLRRARTSRSSHDLPAAIASMGPTCYVDVLAVTTDDGVARLTGLLGPNWAGKSPLIRS